MLQFYSYTFVLYYTLFPFYGCFLLFRFMKNGALEKIDGLHLVMLYRLKQTVWDLLDFTVSLLFKF